MFTHIFELGALVYGPFTIYEISIWTRTSLSLYSNAKTKIAP